MNGTMARPSLLLGSGRASLWRVRQRHPKAHAEIGPAQPLQRRRLRNGRAGRLRRGLCCCRKSNESRAAL